MNALQRDLSRVLHTLHAIDPKDAKRFAQDIDFFARGLDLLGYVLSDERLHDRPVQLREEALAARVAYQGVSAACRAVLIAFEKLKRPDQPATDTPTSATRTTPAAEAVRSSTARSTSLQRRTVIDAEFEDDAGTRSRRRARGARAEQLQLGAVAVLALPAPKDR